MIILIIIGTAYFIELIFFSFNKGNVLDFYYDFMSEKLELSNPKLFKVVCGCIYCFGFWASIISFTIFKINTNYIETWFLLPIFCGLVHLIFKINDKLNL